MPPKSQMIEKKKKNNTTPPHPESFLVCIKMLRISKSHLYHICMDVAVD